MDNKKKNGELVKKVVRNDLISVYKEDPDFFQDENKENVFYPKKETEEQNGPSV